MISLYLLSLFLITTFAFDKVADPALSGKLKTAVTNLDRLNVLNRNEQWIFNFKEQEKYTFKPGGVINANAATFPALTGLGMTLAILNLGPCAMLAPHSHPRAANLVVAISGNTTTWMVNENGANVVETTLSPMQMTIFPAGSLHSMQNNGCDEVQLVSALNSEDTGTLNHLNSLYLLPPDMINAALGYVDIDVSKIGRQIPPVGTGSVNGSAECRKRCNLDK